MWARFTGARCYATLRDFQRRWIDLFSAVAAHDAPQAAAIASGLLATQTDLGRDAREYLVMAGMTGYIAAGEPLRAKALWEQNLDQIGGAGRPVFRLLRCHAERGNEAACAAAFKPYAG